MKLFDWSTSVSHGSNLFLPHHYCRMWRTDRISFSQCIVNAQNLTWLCPHMRRCPQEKVPTSMPLGELVLNMGGPLTITMPPHPGWPAPFQKHSHSVTHNRGDQVKALQVGKSGNQLLICAVMPSWPQARVDKAIEPRMRRRRISSSWGAAWQIGT